jgi:NADH-quinone oxidoreductase subunit G
VVVDHTESRVSRAADVVLPAATFAESTGTVVNNEGRAQRYYQVFTPQGDVRESRTWLADIARALEEESAGPGSGHGASSGRHAQGGSAEGWSVDVLTRMLAEELPVFGPLVDVAPAAGFRVFGMKIPRQPHRYSGRTAMHADVDVFEAKPPEDGESPLAFSMEGFEGHPPPQLLPRLWAPGWNSDQAINRFQEGVGGPLHGGEVGVRLVEPAKVRKVSHFLEVPSAFGPTGKGMLVVALHHIFGSEELSLQSPSVAACAPSAYIGLGPETAGDLEVEEGALVSLQTGERVRFLPVRILSSLPPRIAAIPVGLPGLEGLGPPFYAEVTDAGEITGREEPRV